MWSYQGSLLLREFLMCQYPKIEYISEGVSISTQGMLGAGCLDYYQGTKHGQIKIMLKYTIQCLFYKMIIVVIIGHSINRHL